MRNGIILQNEIREKIQKVEKENNASLSNLQKILLSIEGPITSVLDILYGDMNIFLLSQQVKTSDESTAELLDIKQNEEIYYREVIVHKNGRPLCYAQSYIPLSRCSAEVAEDLFSEKITTGTIMSYRHIETVRTISNISIEKPTPLLQDLFKTDVDFIMREYDMKHKKKIVVHTKEAYPISYFTEM